MKKTVINTFITATALTIASATWAQTTPPTWPTPPSPAPGDIQALETYISALYQNVGNFMINQNYQPISHLNQTITTNTQSVIIQPTTGSSPAQTLFPNQAAAAQAKQATSNNLFNALQQFPYAVFQGTPSESKTFQSAEGQSFSDYMKENEPKRLVVDPNLPLTSASDTLYGTTLQVTQVQSETAPAGSTSAQIKAWNQRKNWVKQPSVLNNDNFNFAAFITPTGYSPAEIAAAQQFVIYAAQSTQDLTASLTNFTKLASNPDALVAIKKDPIYANFTLTMRSILAIRSITINTLNQLIAERTPMTGLAAAAGFKAKDKASLTPTEQNELSNNQASPLQVEAYQANHRIQDPKWYHSVQNASPADVQRNILIMLAEIEHQNYEAHLDRERLLAALTASNLQSNIGAIKNVLTQEGPKLNTEIDTVIQNQKPAAAQKPTKTPGSPMGNNPPPPPTGTTTTTTTTGNTGQ